MSNKLVEETLAMMRAISFDKGQPASDGFTIQATKDAERSPVLAVAQARSLLKSGWVVHIIDAAGQRYQPSEFDEILSFDRQR